MRKDIAVAQMLKKSLGFYEPSMFETDSGDLPESISYPYNLKWFRMEEFERCTPSCSILDMNPNFMYQLDRLRELLKKPIRINSAFRSVQYEIEHGRSGTSSHCKGFAVDIAIPDNRYRLDLILAALSPGFEFMRIGIGENFVHLDLDNDKPPALWTYHDKKFEEIL